MDIFGTKARAAKAKAQRDLLDKYISELNSLVNPYSRPSLVGPVTASTSQQWQKKRQEVVAKAEALKALSDKALANSTSDVFVILDVLGMFKNWEREVNSLERQLYPKQ